MLSFLKSTLKEAKTLKVYLMFALCSIIFAYSVYLLFEEDVINRLGVEDGIFEWLTALFFFLTSVLFFCMFFYKRNIIVFFFGLIFLIGSGEEISWGQRLFNFETPETIKEQNVQGEFTLHNLEIFNNEGFNGEGKSGLSRLLAINFLYKLFWLVYCVLLPLLYFSFPFIKKIVSKINLPIPPFSLGIFFLLSWLVFRVSHQFLLPEGKTPQYYDTINEINEFVSSFLFFLLSLYFLFNTTEYHKALFKYKVRS